MTDPLPHHSEFRAGLGYNQPSSPLSAVGVMAAASGATASKYGARRETPVYYPENCTQCMACITACPDTALPTTTHELGTILETAFNNYISNGDDRVKMVEAIPTIDTAARFAVIGDYGVDLNEHEVKVAALVRSWNPEFIITLGDNRYGAIDYDSAVGQHFC